MALELRVVHRQRVGLAFQLELRPFDSVGRPAHDRTEIRVAFHVIVDGIEAVNDVGDFAVAVRNVKLRDDGPVARDLEAKPVLVVECVDLHASYYPRAPTAPCDP